MVLLSLVRWFFGLFSAAFSKQLAKIVAAVQCSAVSELFSERRFYSCNQWGGRHSSDTCPALLKTPTAAAHMNVQGSEGRAECCFAVRSVLSHVIDGERTAVQHLIRLWKVWFSPLTLTKTDKLAATLVVFSWLSACANGGWLTKGRGLGCSPPPGKRWYMDMFPTGRLRHLGMNGDRAAGSLRASGCGPALQIDQGFWETHYFDFELLIHQVDSWLERSRFHLKTG